MGEPLVIDFGPLIEAFGRGVRQMERNMQAMTERLIADQRVIAEHEAEKAAALRWCRANGNPHKPTPTEPGQ